MRNTIILNTIICLIIAASTKIYAQEHENIEQVGRMYHYWDYAENVIIIGDYAYVSAGIAGLQILDVSDRESPEQINFYEGNWTLGKVVTSGNYAYVEDFTIGITILSIENPRQPVNVGSYEIEDSPVDHELSGNFVYTLDRHTGIQILSIEDPENPEMVGSVDFRGNYWDIAVSGDYAYVAGFDAGLLIISIVDPENPEVLDYYDLDTRVFAVEAVDEMVYIGCDRPRMLRIISVANPERPNELSSLETPSVTRSLTFSNDIIYVSDGLSGMGIISVADPRNPEELTYHNTPGFATSTAISGDHAFIADRNAGLRIVDISDPANPEESGSFSTDGHIKGVTSRGEFAYIANGIGGMKVLSLDDPENPDEVGNLDMEANTVKITLHSEYAYVITDMPNILRIVNIEDPENPTEVASYEEDRVSDIAISDDLAYVVRNRPYIRILSIEDPENPEEIGMYEMEDENAYLNCITISDGFAYVGSEGEFPFHILSLEDPGNPVELGKLDLELWRDVEDIVISSDYAYFTHSDGFFVISITDPENPELIVDSYQTMGGERELSISGDMAYVSGPAGLHLISIEDPENLVDLGYYLTPGRTTGHTVLDNGLIYAANTTHLGIYRYWADGLPPEINVIPDSLIFEDVALDSSEVQILTITNSGEGDLLVSDITVDSEQFSTDFDSLFTLAPDSTRHVRVTYTPNVEGHNEGIMYILSNDPIYDSLTVALIGNTPNAVGEDKKNIVSRFYIATAYPNPFNSTVQLSYGLLKAGHVEFSIFDQRGRKVQTLFSGDGNPGMNKIKWNANGVAAGLYFIQLEQFKRVATKKLLLIK